MKTEKNQIKFDKDMNMIIHDSKTHIHVLRPRTELEVFNNVVSLQVFVALKAQSYKHYIKWKELES